MRQWHVFFLVGSLLPALAIADTTQDPRRIEEMKREMVDQSPSRLIEKVNSFFFEAGGWVNYRYSDYNNADNDKSVEDSLDHSSWSDLRVWGRLVYRTPEMEKEKLQHFVYLRLKDVYVQRAGAFPGDRYDNRGPLLDYAYASFDLKPWKVEAGRRYFNIGRGMVISGVLDGVQLNYQKPGWNLGAFTAMTKPHDNNIDTSVPGYDKVSRRYFAGAGIGYAGIRGHQLYGYSVIERDHSRERPVDDTQDYHYDAVYVAAGSKGQWGKRWPYWAEVVRETGTSIEYLSNAKSDVRAWAVDVEQKFLTLWKSGLVLSTEYAAGSGDADRIDVTNTINGNRAGRDHNFLYFGYLPTGIALAPQLSNLRMARAGLEINPFFALRGFRKLTLSADYYYYWKDRAAGGIYDVDATEPARDIGHEVDLRADWRIGRRIILSAEWGQFTPGKAYPDTKRTHDEVSSLSLSYIF